MDARARGRGGAWNTADLSRTLALLLSVLLSGCRLPPAQPVESPPVTPEPARARPPTRDRSPPSQGAATPDVEATPDQADPPSHCRDCELEAGRCVEWVMDGIDDRTVAYQMDCDEACCAK